MEKKEILKAPVKANFIDLLEKGVDLILKDPDKLSRARPITNVDIEKRKEIKRDREVTTYNSGFDFLKNLNGWRKGEVHVVLGDKGDGKSTFSRSILLDLLKNGHRPLIYLSEDDAEEYITDILGVNSRAYDDQVAVIGELNQLAHLKTSEEPIDTLIKTFVIYLETAIKLHKPDFLVIDNISTSVVFDENDKKAVLRFYNYLHRIATFYDMPVLFFSHVKSDLKKMPYKVNDIRGNKSLINMTENTASIYKVMRKDPDTGDYEIRSCFHWIVCRKQKCSNFKYGLFFDFDTQQFMGDYKMAEDEFYEYYVKPPKHSVDEGRLQTLKNDTVRKRDKLKQRKMELDLASLV